MNSSNAMNKGRMECTITWFVENYSYTWQRKGESLISPDFVTSLEETAWTLRKRSFDKNLGNFPQKFEIALFAGDGKSALHSIEREFKWSCVFGYGPKALTRIDEVLMRQKSKYLHQDTLIIRCRMWSDEPTIRRAEHFSVRTRIGTEKISFLHKVESFSDPTPNEKSTKKIQSPSNKECCISSSLYFLDIWSFEGTMIIKIEASEKNYILRKLNISLLDRSGNIVRCCEVDNRFDDTVTVIRKVPLSLKRQIILNKANEYLPNNELSLRCECTFSTGVELNRIEEIQYAPAVPTIPSSEDGYNAAGSSALEDLETIYNNQRLTDIELKTETKSFPAHKLVLCARSSVFDAMLANDMKEKNTGCIRNETVEQLLLFLYSDKLKNLNWESAIKLYYTGEKYAIEKLKFLSSSFLIDNLSTANACELLLLSDTHNDADLKKFVEDFILHHEDGVFGSDEWEKLMDSNPQLASKTMHLKYKRKKEGK